MNRRDFLTTTAATVAGIGTLGPAFLFGRSRYATYYLFCVIGAALMHLIVMSTSGLPPMPMIGASGGVFGLLLAFTPVFGVATIVARRPGRARSVRGDAHGPSPPGLDRRVKSGGTVAP